LRNQFNILGYLIEGLLGVLFGTGVISLLLPGAYILHQADANCGYSLAGSLLYLVGTVGITLAANVPCNDALARLDPDDVQVRECRTDYVRGWTLRNHVRTTAGLTAVLTFTLALC